MDPENANEEAQNNTSEEAEELPSDTTQETATHTENTDTESSTDSVDDDTDTEVIALSEDSEEVDTAADDFMEPRSAPEYRPPEGAMPFDPDLVDLDGDGIPDATAGEDFMEPRSAPEYRPPEGAVPFDPDLVDLDGDGIPDASSSDTVQPTPSTSNYTTPAQAIGATTPNSNSANTNEAAKMTNQMSVTPPTGNQSGNFEDYVINPDPTWPAPIYMKKNVSPRERYYLEYRWYSQWSFYDSKATQNKNTYYWYQRIIVIGSLIIPALISLNSTIARFITSFAAPGDANAETMVRIGVDSITVFISLAVAGSAALESLYKYGENWSSYRAAAEELQAEKNFYDMHAGPYEQITHPFPAFVTRVENVIAKQNGQFFQAVQAQIQKQAEDNEAILDAYYDEEDDDDQEEVPATVSLG